MKNLKKWLPLLLAVGVIAVVVVFVVLESFYESSVQLDDEATAQALPDFLIERRGNSAFDLELSSERRSYVPGDLVFVDFELNRPAYVYIWAVEPEDDGKRFVRLLFPSSSHPLNYGDSGKFSFHAPFSEGTGHLQAVASTRPLSASDHWEDDATLTPDGAKQAMLENIATRGLSNSAWSSSWATYLVAFGRSSDAEVSRDTAASAVDALPSDTSSGKLKVLVAETGTCKADGVISDSAKIYNAQVYVDGANHPINLSDPSATSATAQPAYQFLNVEAGRRTVFVSLPHRYQGSTTPVYTLPESAKRGNKIEVEGDGIVQVCVELEALPRGVAQFSMTPAFPLVGQVVRFEPGQSLGVTYSWDFGDGSEPVIGNARDMVVVNHTYTLPDTYTATFTVNYDRSSPGVCPGNLRRLETKCVVEHIIDVAAASVNLPDPQKVEPPVDDNGRPSDVTVTEDVSATLQLAEAGCFAETEETPCGITLMNAVLDLDDRLDGVSFSFDFRYKQFPFRQNELDKLSATSYMAVSVTFLDDQGNDVFPNTVWHCTLQTQENSMMENCDRLIPTGDNVSGTATLDLIGSSSNLRALNTMITLNLIQQMRVSATAHLNLRKNEIKDAPIEVEYSNLELKLDAGE